MTTSTKEEKEATVKQVEGNKITMDDGLTYTLGKFETVPAVGETLKFTVNPWSKNGVVINYMNLMKSKRPYTSRSRPFLPEDPERQKKIIRQNVLGHAVEISKMLGTETTTQKQTEKVEQIAEQLETWVNR